MSRKLFTVAAAVVLMACSTAVAQEPFLPGQVRSQALAAETFPVPCAHVGVAPMDQAHIDQLAGGEADAGELDLGVALIGQCQIGLNPTAIAQLANYHFQGAFKHKAALVRREVEMITCTVITHEYGHLAGLGHDMTDPHDVMSPVLAYTWPPCRKLFPRR